MLSIWDIASIKLLAKQGKSKKEIAGFLNVTEKDVNYHYQDYFLGGIKGLIK